MTMMAMMKKMKKMKKMNESDREGARCGGSGDDDDVVLGSDEAGSTHPPNARLLARGVFVSNHD